MPMYDFAPSYPFKNWKYLTKLSSYTHVAERSKRFFTLYFWQQTENGLVEGQRNSNSVLNLLILLREFKKTVLVVWEQEFLIYPNILVK